uniref:Uncharacterized protein n=1 Tax=Anguilla anguilla TaxID=7936 RepID=A0A0E9S0X6_ANGAN
MRMTLLKQNRTTPQVCTTKGGPEPLL